MLKLSKCPVFLTLPEYYPIATATTKTKNNYIVTKKGQNGTVGRVELLLCKVTGSNQDDAFAV